MRWRALLVIFVFFLVLPSVSSISLRGSTVGETINFKPDLTKKYSWTVGSTSGEQVDVQVSKSGKFSEYISLSDTLIKDLTPGESTSFSATFNLPSKVPDFEPGKYRNKICVKEVKSGGKEVMSATTSTCAAISIRLLHSGKYVSVDLKSPNVNAGEKVPFKVIVHNLGKENIQNVGATLTIFEKGVKIGTLSTDEVSLASKERKTLNATLSTSNYNQGKYQVMATVNYDGRTKKVNSSFKVGKLGVDILNWTKKVKTGKINEFKIQVESKWNTKIDSIHAEVLVEAPNSSGNIASFKTSPASLEPFRNTSLKGFWNTEGLSEGDYEAKIIARYLEENTTKEVTVKAERPEGEGLGINTTYLIGAAIVVVIAISFILWRKYER